MRSGDTPSTHLSLFRELAQDSPNRDEAWRTFFRRYYSTIVRWCRSWLKNETEADELASPVFEKLVKSIQAYDPAQGHFRPWLKTVVNNTVRSEFRHRATHPGDFGEGGSDNQEQLEALIEQLETTLDSRIRDDLERAMAEVKRQASQSDWAAFERVVVDGQDVAEVASRLGKRKGAVYQAIYRVKKLLRKAFDDFQNDSE